MCVNTDGTTGPAADRRGIDLNRLVEDAPKAVFFFATQAVLPAIISQKRGVIVSLASMAGKIGSCTNPWYNASKAAVRRRFRDGSEEKAGNPADSTSSRESY